jgi:hypothetical protein
MLSLENLANNDTEDISLASLSDKEIRTTYYMISSLVNNVSDYNVESVVNSINTNSIETISEIIERKLGREIVENIENSEIALICDKFEEDIKDWNYFQTEVLNFTLLKKISENIDYVGERISFDHLKMVYNGKYTSDLTYIWLSSIRSQLQSEK